MAVRYSFECPQCHAPVELTTTQAGQEISCNGCESAFLAPKLGDIKKLPVVGGGEPETGKRRASKAKSGSPVKGWLFAGGLLLAAIAGISGYLAQDYANDLHVPFDIEEVVAKELSSVDEMSPAEIYGIAVAACDEGFQLEYREVPYRTQNIKAGIFQNVAWVCWAVGGIGLLMLLSSLFLKK